MYYKLFSINNIHDPLGGVLCTVLIFMSSLVLAGQHACLGGVIVSMLALSAPIVDSFPWSDQH